MQENESKVKIRRFAARAQSRAPTSIEALADNRADFVVCARHLAAINFLLSIAGDRHAKFSERATKPLAVFGRKKGGRRGVSLRCDLSSCRMVSVCLRLAAAISALIARARAPRRPANPNVGGDRLELSDREPRCFCDSCEGDDFFPTNTVN